MSIDSSFADKVYEAVRHIPKGYVATYGQIAEIIGCPGAARAVGNALHINPYAPVVPCHRVVAADGSLAPDFGCGGPSVQYERLLAEKVKFGQVRPACRCPDFPCVDLTGCGIVIERHPLEPFLPENGRILFLGSFPPPKARWSMEFFYPNWINDFWRIQGLIHFGDQRRFEAPGRHFDCERIVGFCKSAGLAFYDTASKVCRWKGNASDEYLEILESADVIGLLRKMPECRVLVTTGGKSSEELVNILRSTCEGISVPPVSSFSDLVIEGRQFRWWRMPSSSRAYPMPLTAKAKEYSRLFAE